MTKENAKEFLPLVQAFAEGKQIQFNPSKYSIPNWQDVYDISFEYDSKSYRIKPEPTRVPLTSEDIPAVCWIRSKDSAELLVYHIDGLGINCREGRRNYDELMRNGVEYSSDRKTWLPCYKEVTK